MGATTDSDAEKCQEEPEKIAFQNVRVVPEFMEPCSAAQSEHS